MAATPATPTPMRWIRVVVGALDTSVAEVAAFTHEAS
jgi:hypothetical protein